MLLNLLKTIYVVAGCSYLCIPSYPMPAQVYLCLFNIQRAHLWFILQLCWLELQFGGNYCLIWRNQQSEQACLLKASVTMTSNFAITIINGSQIVPSTQFHSQGLGQRVVWFLCISKGASCWDWLYLNKHICTGEEFFI